MRIRLSPDVIKELKTLKKKDVILFQRIEKQLELFKQNPTHPSLRSHKLTGSLKHMWSISISKSIRMVYVLLPKDETYFVDIGTHDEVYKK